MATALGLACALLTAACSDDFSLTEPISAPVVSYNKFLSAADSELDSATDSELDSAAESELELVESDLSFTASRGWGTIGRKGGTVTLWAHTPADGGWRPYHSLVVPPGTVRKPTYFVIEIGADPVIDVYLRATEVSSGRRITEFDKPLVLTLTYSGSSIADPAALEMVHVVDGIISEIVASTVDADRELIMGELWHFSRYAVAVE